jgi:hypothetical protein
MSRFVVLLEVFYQLVVGIGSYSEATLGTCNFFGHAYRLSKGPASQFNICHLGFSSFQEKNSGPTAKIFSTPPGPTQISRHS